METFNEKLEGINDLGVRARVPLDAWWYYRELPRIVANLKTWEGRMTEKQREKLRQAGWELTKLAGRD